MKKIWLGGKHGSVAGRFALVSDRDYGIVRGYNWTADKDRRTFYALTNLPRADGKRKRLAMHRLITEFRWLAVDHIDHNGLNNQRSNLRDGTLINALGQQSQSGSSIYVGVSWRKDISKWQAHVRIDGKLIRIGYHLVEEDAARARDEYVRALSDAKFRVYNFPRKGEQRA